MVASISARLGYYEHLGQDDYYMRDGEPPGWWAGEGAARLSLSEASIRKQASAWQPWAASNRIMLLVGT